MTTPTTDKPSIEPSTDKQRYFRMDDGISYTRSPTRQGNPACDRI